MKKLIIVLTLIALMITLVACNNKKNNDNGETPTSTPTENKSDKTKTISAEEAEQLVAKANKYLQDNPYFICNIELDSTATGISVKQKMTNEISGKNAKSDSNLGDSAKLVQTIVDGVYYASSESTGNAKIKRAISEADAKSEIENMFSQVTLVISYMKEITNDYTLITGDDGSQTLYISLTQTEDNEEASLTIYINFDKDGRYTSVSYESASSNTTTEETTKVSCQSLFEYKDSSFKISAPADASEYIDSTSRR